MNPLRSILVIVDPTAQAHPAVDKASRLAEKFGARLELFICDSKASRQARLAEHSRQHPDDPFLLNVKATIEALAAPLRARGLDVTTETECADPLYAALIDRTQRTTADLVVKDTHHHSLAKRTFLTNTDWHLIRSCPVPLLLTKARQWSAAAKVVAAVDPGHVNDKPVALDRRILDHASELARRLGGELHVLHAYVPAAIIVAATAAAPPMVASVSAQDLAVEQEAKLKEVSALVAEYGVPAANIHVEVGGPAEVLTRMADHLQADVLVMGAISRSGLKRTFIGNTAEDVLERLPCDALIVKPPDFAALLPFI